jgi:hypothetical protein
MGGWRFGAGRRGWRVKAEHLLQLDARKMAREGAIEQGSGLRMGSWSWRQNGEEVGRVGYTASRDTVTVYAGEFHQALPVLRTPCHYGGSRCWFGCPRCGRRVAILYWRNGPGFGCRGCSQVAYSTQSKGWLERAVHRQAKTESRLTEEGLRPRGMHRKTYDALLADIEENERLVAAGLAQMLGLVR